MNELKNEINEIYKLKEQYEEYYGNRIVNLEKEIDHYRNASSVSMNHNNNS